MLTSMNVHFLQFLVCRLLNFQEWSMKEYHIHKKLLALYFVWTCLISIAWPWLPLSIPVIVANASYQKPPEALSKNSHESNRKEHTYRVWIPKYPGILAFTFSPQKEIIVDEAGHTRPQCKLNISHDSNDPMWTKQTNKLNKQANVEGWYRTLSPSLYPFQHPIII